MAYSQGKGRHCSAAPKPGVPRAANAGQVSITGAAVTSVEMGLMLAGDANDDDQVNTSDFVILKATFGKGCGDRADFIGNCVVDLIDFGLLKVNFGRGGAPLVGPR